MSIETSPTDVTIILLGSIDGGRYAHFNQYLHTDKPHIGDIYSSIHRLARAAQYNTWAKAPETGEDILVFLSDMSDTDYPVYREGTSKDPYVSYTTSLFDLQGEKVHVYTKRPVNGNAPAKPDLILDLNKPLTWPA